MEGWLKLHRSIADHWIYSFKEPDKALAWIDLLIMARHTSGTIMLKGRALELKRGQVGMSQLAMQKRWGWSQNKVKRFLELLKKHSMCDYETNDLTTVITICNFDSFQSRERADERPNERADERATNDQSNDDIRMEELKKGKKQDLTPYQAIVDSYHDRLPMLPAVHKLTVTRKRHIKQRYDEQIEKGKDVTYFDRFFEHTACQSEWLLTRGFCNLEWLMKEANHIKVIEGAYPREQQAS